MRQKLALARALMHRPQLVFLDEPTAGLDVMAAAAVRDDLETLTSSEGVTVFLTTHNMAEAERLCSQVAVIREGKLIVVGSPDDLRKGTERPQVEIVGRGFDESMLTLLKERPEVAEAEFQRAFEISDGKFLLAKVFHARYYAPLIVDEELFERELNEVLEAPSDALPEVRLLNEIAKAKARIFLANKSRYF